jgi:hypothetical protein
VSLHLIDLHIYQVDITDSRKFERYLMLVVFKGMMYILSLMKDLDFSKVIEGESTNTVNS